MKIRWFAFGFGLFLLLLAGVWAWDVRFHERVFNFFRKPLQGKIWQSEVEKFENLYPKSGVACVMFIGDSHIEQCEWNELFPDRIILNRGIGGETSSSLLLRLNSTFHNLRPECVIIQTGINDLIAGEPIDSVLANHQKIFFFLRNKTSNILPTLIFPTRYMPDVNNKVDLLNQKLREFYLANGFKVLDIRPQISGGKRLSATCTPDGIHLNAQGYKIWQNEIRLNLVPSTDSR